jgi:hypothetical protein
MRKLPTSITKFLVHNPGYEASYRPDPSLMRQLKIGEVHPFIIHSCPRECWAVFVETDEIDQFLAAYPRAVAATFNGLTLELMRRH